MSVRSILFILNIVAVVLLGYVVVRALRKSPETSEPANLTPFYGDEDLENRRLERGLGAALVFAAVVAVALPLYWLREPNRQDSSIEYFDEGAAARGEVLYANSTSEVFNAAVSLQCANCHGSNGEGGAANSIFTPPDGDPIQVSWKAPALDTVFLRYSEDEVRDVLFYGRPGTPMQAWGVAGGGPKNDQSIDDLLAYLATIQLTPEEAKARTDEDLAAARRADDDAVTAAEEALTAAEETRTKAEDDLAEIEDSPDATDIDLRDAEQALEDAEQGVADAEEAVAWTQAYAASREGVTDGQLLFELNCARCHTSGWSIFDPTRPGGTLVLGKPGGGGTIGFNLRDGGPVNRFGPGEAGATSQAEFIKAGSEKNKPYGRFGQGSGRMPGFGELLTDEQIDAVVEYEREDLDDTTYLEPDALDGGQE